MSSIYIGSTLTGYNQETITARALSGQVVFDAKYFEQSTATTEVVKSGQLEIDLLPSFAETTLPSSINFGIGAKNYLDKSGMIVTDLNPSTGESTVAGVIDYTASKVKLNAGSWQSVGAIAVKLNSLATTINANTVDAVTFRTPKSPVRPSSLTIRATAFDGTKITLVSDNSGNITGGSGSGKVDYEYGVVDVRFGKWVADDAVAQAQSWYNTKNVSNGKVWKPIHVFADSITYNASSYSYLPIDSNVTKIDTVRLPKDGRIPIFKRGYDILISNRKVDNLGSAFTGGQTIQLSRPDVDRICLNDADNKAVNAELWDYDLENGSITFKPSIDLSSYKMPLSAVHIQEQRNRITDTDIDGTLSLQFETNRLYPIEDTYVSSLLLSDGDLQVRVSVPFTQKNWDNVWRDTPNGSQLLNKLNLTSYPMILTDDGAITDRWLIKFTSGSQFELYSEALGFVGKFDTLTDLAPINPATAKPYFTIDKRAFGTDTPWSPQDVIRFNTWCTLMPVWVLCAVQPNPNPPTGEDGFEQYLFGDTTELTI